MAKIKIKKICEENNLTCENKEFRIKIGDTTFIFCCHEGFQHSIKEQLKNQ